MDRKIEINLRTLLIFAAIAGAAYILWQIRGVLYIVTLAYLIAVAVLPLAAKLQVHRLPRTASIFAAYIFVLALIIGLATLVIPPLVSESSKFYAMFPGYFEKVTRDLQIDASVVNQNIERVGASFLRVVLSLVSDTVQFVTIFVVSVYIAFERRNFKKYLIEIFGDTRGSRIESVIEHVEVNIGRWLRGQIVLCLIIGVVTYVGLTALKFPYAVPLAVIAGILEAVPNIGPILSSIPAVIIGFSNSTFSGVVAIALYVLIQQFENHLIVPRVMAGVTGLRPLAVIIVLLIGGSLMGTIGVILAIPAFLVVKTIVEETVKK